VYFCKKTADIAEAVKQYLEAMKAFIACPFPGKIEASAKRCRNAKAPFES
jgi:hypothetical protein